MKHIQLDGYIADHLEVNKSATRYQRKLRALYRYENCELYGKVSELSGFIKRYSACVHKYSRLDQ